MIDQMVMSELEIKECVQSLRKHFARMSSPVIYIILDGGCVFGADLARATYPYIAGVDLIRVERGYDTGKPHEPVLTGKPPVFLAKHEIVFVDVISETGETFEFLKELAPESFRRIVTIALVVKGTAYTPNLFGKRIVTKNLLCGYGMGPHRELPYIAEIKEE